MEDKIIAIYCFIDDVLKSMNQTIDEVKSAVSDWQRTASYIGISRSEQTLMSSAFKI